MFVSVFDPALAVGQEKQPVVDILPAQSLEIGHPGKTVGVSTHSTLELTPDKSELIRIEEDAASIVIGNPVHVSVLADTARTLIVVPRAPGATHFSVLNKKGDVIMQRHVIVAAPKKQYIRIRQSCAAVDGDGCEQTQVYYCPDMCHKINLVAEDADAPESQLEDQEQGTASGSSENNTE